MMERIGKTGKILNFHLRVNVLPGVFCGWRLRGDDGRAIPFLNRIYDNSALQLKLIKAQPAS
jgi:hypothetical protein